MHGEKTTSTNHPGGARRPVVRPGERESGRNEMFAQEAAFAPFPVGGWVSGFLQPPQ